MVAVQRRGGLFMKSVHQLDWLGENKGNKFSELLQAEPKTNMKEEWWKQQVAEEGTVVKLGMAGDENTKQLYSIP